MYEYNQLDLASLASYKAYIPKEILKKTSSLRPEEKLIVFGASQKNIPLGICIATLDTEQKFLDVLHLTVSEDHQNNDEIGTTLLSKTQEEATKQGAFIFTFAYALDAPETPMIEKILKANQWKGTRPFLIKALFDVATFDMPILHNKIQYPPGYKEFSWKNLKPDQRRDLSHREIQGHFSAAISPLNNKKTLASLTSLGLEYNDRVVGWSITHRVNRETLLYSAIYIEPEHKGHEIATKLLADTIILLKKNMTKWVTIEIPYLFIHPSWVHYIERKILPKAFKITRYRQGWHTIP